jgi:hypothetical protein
MQWILERIESKIDILIRRLVIMSAVLSQNFLALQTQVTNTDGVIASAVTAFQGISAQLAAAIAAQANGDTAALPNLQASLSSATQVLATAIAGTSSVPTPAAGTSVTA